MFGKAEVVLVPVHGDRTNARLNTAMVLRAIAWDVRCKAGTWEASPGVDRAIDTIEDVMSRLYWRVVE